MTTFFYRFDSEQACVDACNRPVEGSELNVYDPPQGMDIIGIIYTQGDDPQPLPGYHVNVPQAVEGWEVHQVHPVNPQRIFWSAE
jgi:hypothetical protein